MITRSREKITQRYLYRLSKDKIFTAHGGRMYMKSLPHLSMEFPKTVISVSLRYTEVEEASVGPKKELWN